MVDVGSLIVAVLALGWAVFTHRQLRRERKEHEATAEDVRLRSVAITSISGLLREIQHCTDDHAGEPAYKSRLEDAIRKARELALHNDRLFGQDVIAAVQRETDVARALFETELGGQADPHARRRLFAARNERVKVLQRLTGVIEFPPPAGALTGAPS